MLIKLCLPDLYVSSVRVLAAWLGYDVMDLPGVQRELAYVNEVAGSNLKESSANV